jgi:hypothetical protein
MAEQRIFEARLADAFERLLDGAPVEVDAVSLTATLATARPRRAVGLRGLLGFRGQPRVAIVVIALLLFALVAAILIGRQVERPVPAPYKGVFVPFGSMVTERRGSVAVTLTDGRVLIAAGACCEGPPVEIVDPVSGESTVSEDGPNGTGTGVLLEDGRVFSITYDSNATGSYAWILDPEAPPFRRLEQAPFPNDAPFGVEPSLARLPDGRVLVSGGLEHAYPPTVLASALLFDPATETFAETGAMLEPRRFHALTTLPDGRVLVAAGEARDGPVTEDDVGTHLAGRSWLDSVEVYDPASEVFVRFGALPTVHGASLAAVLPDGRPWVVPRLLAYDAYWLTSGQVTAYEPHGPVSSDIVDVAAGIFSAGPALPGPVASVNQLRDGRFLLIGARVAPGAPTFEATWEAWAATYDPTTGTLADVPAPGSRLASAVALPDGRVMLLGGDRGDSQVGLSRAIEVFE